MRGIIIIIVPVEIRSEIFVTVNTKISEFPHIPSARYFMYALF
jgi:hypothetical protein